MNQLETILHTILHARSWKTIPELAQETGFLQTSISAQLRHLRKKEHGGFTIHKQRRKQTQKKLLWEYRLEPRRNATRGEKHSAHQPRPAQQRRNPPPNR